MGGFTVRRRRTVKPPIPVVLSDTTVKLTVLGDEVPMATVDQVASCALAGLKNRRRPTHGSGRRSDVDRLMHDRYSNRSNSLRRRAPGDAELSGCQVAAGNQVVFEFPARDVPPRLECARPAGIGIDLERPHGGSA